MLILDEGKARQHRRQKTIERTREVTFEGAFNDATDTEWVADKEHSVANVERQAGRKLHPDEFMKKLHLINKDIVYKPHPGFMVPNHISRDKGCLYLKVGDKEIFLFVCEGDWMPEWSIFNTKEARIPDRSNPEAPWRKVERPRYVVKRGWREVLIMLIMKGLIGLDATERVFGAGDRPSWKVLTGKGSGAIF